jgi:Helix-loop-helix DNA-binding domain
MGPKPKMIVLHPVHGYRIRPQEDLKTIKRNARERNRVQTVNQGFEKLRLHIPSAAADKKMSKVNILGHAVNYIQCLHAMIQSQQQQQHLLQSTSCLPQSPGVSSTSDYFSSPDASFNMSATASSQVSTFTEDFSLMSTPFSHSFGGSSLQSPNSSGSCYSPHTPFTPHSPFTPVNTNSQPYSGHHPHQQLHFSFPAAGGSSVQQLQQRQLFHHVGSHVVQAAPEEDTSEGEEDILDAIVEWQDHTPS